MSQNRKVYGCGAEFDSAADLIHAAQKVRDLGFSRWDVHSPFPIHGMDRAMGLGKSWLSALVFCGGLIGLITGVLLTTLPSFVIYPMIVNGKPYDWRTLPAFFPICFELTVLLAAFTAVGSMLVLNRIPKWHHPVFNWDLFRKSTDDGFFLIIEARDQKFSETNTRLLLESIGGHNITLIAEQI